MNKYTPLGNDLYTPQVNNYEGFAIRNSDTLRRALDEEASKINDSVVQKTNAVRNQEDTIDWYHPVEQEGY